jgi:hypothetical protein
MLNPHNQNEELGARAVEMMLKAQASGIFTDIELQELAILMGISEDWRREFLPHYETKLQRILRMAREGKEAGLRG